MKQSPNNAFTHQLYYGKIKIGTDRYLHLSAQDIGRIQQAHDILTKHVEAPPTIDKLSEMVFTQSTKTTSGIFHITIISQSETLSPH